MVGDDQPGVFKAYANIYDALYHDKNYEKECDFLEEVFHRFAFDGVKSILDMGCGTGGHAIPLAERGYGVYGIDRSERMLSVARKKTDDSGLSDKIQLKTADVRGCVIDKTFDAVIAMFAVLSYQVSNDDLFSTLKTARRHLRLGGLFVCDFWYGPAVLRQRPEERVKSLQENDDRIVRIVKPEIDTQKNVVDVYYDILRLRGDRLIEDFKEKHSMRFIFKPEIEFFLRQAGFSLNHFCSFLDIEKEVCEDTWNVTAISRAI